MDVRGRNHVVVTGPAEGPALILSHGFGCDQSMWRLVAPALAEHYRVVLFDHIGAGRSDLSAWRHERYATLDGYAQDVLDICAALDLRDAVFVGHSVSAMIGVLAANREPDRFARLILVTPSARYMDDVGYRGGFSTADIQQLLDSLDSNYLGWATAMAPMIMGNPDRPELSEELTTSFRASDPTIARAFARTTFLSDNRADLPKVTVPTLVIQCARDMIAPPEVGEFVHEHIADSTLVTVEATGHCPQLSAPETITQAIISYLTAAP